MNFNFGQILKVATKLMLCLCLTIGPFLVYQYNYQTHKDPYYCLVTHQSSILITGSSRAKRGIVPSILQEKIKLDEMPLNIAINGLNSPYGKSYFNFIKDKVKKSKNGLFLLDVSPPCLMDRGFEKDKKPREEDFFLYQLYNLNQNPNLEYLARANSQNEKKANEKERFYETIYHPTGWWEAVVKTENKFPKNKYGKATFFKSNKREAYLEKTLAFLKQHGTPILVRLPASKKAYESEENWYPYFNKRIIEIAQKHDVEFLNYSQQYDLFNFYDDKSHMDGENAKKFTELLAKDILQKIKN